MKYSKEIKVGFLAIVGVMMSVFSYNYLKGINLFEKNRKFTIKYEKVDGLSVSNPVTLNGFKIGKVQTGTRGFFQDVPVKPIEIQKVTKLK